MLPLFRNKAWQRVCRSKSLFSPSRYEYALLAVLGYALLGCTVAFVPTSWLCAQERISEETASEAEGANIDYQPGELVEVKLFEKWIAGRMVEKVGERQFRVKIQVEGRRREANFDANKIRRIGPEAIIPLTELRQWADASGKHKIEARLTKIGEENATLLKGNGSKISVPIAKLSNLDQQLIRRLARNKRKRDPVTGGEAEALASSDDGSSGEAEGAEREGRRGRRASPRANGEGREATADLEGDAGEHPASSQAGPPSAMVAAADPLESNENVELRERAGPPGAAGPEGGFEPTVAEEAGDPNLVHIDPTGTEPLILSPPETPLIALGSPTPPQTVTNDIQLSQPQEGTPTSVAGMAVAEESGIMLVAMSAGGPGVSLIYGTDLKSGSELFQLPLKSTQTLLDVSPDGSRFATLVTRLDGTSAAAIWESAGGAPKRILDLAFSDGRGIQFVRFRSQEGLVVVTDTSIFGVDYTTESATVRYQVDAVVTAIAAAPDRSGMALIADGTLLLIASDTGTAMASLTADGFNPQGMAFRADATRLAAVGNSQVQVWDLTTGSPLSSVDLPQPVRGNEIVFVNDNYVFVTQAMLVPLEGGAFGGNYQLATPHESGALRSFGGVLWYGFVDPAGGSPRLIPVALPQADVGEGTDAAIILGGAIGSADEIGHGEAGLSPEEQGFADPNEEGGREPGGRPGHGPGK
jgi:SLA1 homology domain 1, SHD1